MGNGHDKDGVWFHRVDEAEGKPVKKGSPELSANFRAEQWRLAHRVDYALHVVEKIIPQTG